jgi:hypothetical protein
VTLDLTVYNGWKIYTHVGKVPRSEIPDLKRKIKSWFDQGEWVYEDNHKTTIYHPTIHSQIEIIFQEETTEQEKSKGLSKYGIVFKSGFFGWRDEYRHQQLCDKVSHKITWQKQAYFLRDNELIPVRKKHLLRMKRR